MAQLLIRDIDEALMQNLKALAKSHERSLQKEAKELLLKAIEESERRNRQLAAIEGIKKLNAKMMRRRKGKLFSGSTEMIRKARQEWL